MSHWLLGTYLIDFELECKSLHDSFLEGILLDYIVNELFVTLFWQNNRDDNYESQIKETKLNSNSILFDSFAKVTAEYFSVVVSNFNQ